MIRDDFLIFGLLFALLIRWLTSRFPYSGAGTPPMFGDYEAQRHWMEITVNLEPTEWYRNTDDNNLQYWGLDYPPLTAYHSYLNGIIARQINPRWVALNASRGYEGYSHKLFMRTTVIVSDALVLFTGVVLYWLANVNVPNTREKSLHIVSTLLYPGFVLIDHGHFQYNCISLGLTFWAVYFMSKNHHFWASAMFTLALSYKQMSLYHAFPFFFYLLGIVFNQPSYLQMLLKFKSIGTAVLGVFFICWFPFLIRPEAFNDVIARLFPFNRGLFESRIFGVHLISCLNYGAILTNIVCALATVATSLPSGVLLFKKPTLSNFKLSLVVTSMSFFLCSYQVHEKTILIPVMSALLLLDKHPLLVLWLALVSTFRGIETTSVRVDQRLCIRGTWSAYAVVGLQPLLEKDGLLIPYVCLMALFIAFCVSVYGDFGLTKADTWRRKVEIVIFLASLLSCFAIFLSSLLVKPPKRYPDIYPVIIAIVSCAHYLVFFGFFYHLQYQESNVKYRMTNGYRQKFM